VNDALGRQTGWVDALGNQGTGTYDGAGQLLTLTSPLNQQSQYEYNARGEQTRATSGYGSSVQNSVLSSYDTAGQQTGSRDANGVWSYTTFDPSGRTIGSSDALLGQTGNQYDLAGQQTRSVDQLGEPTDYVYNSRGWVTKTTDALGNVS